MKFSGFIIKHFQKFLYSLHGFQQENALDHLQVEIGITTND